MSRATRGNTTTSQRVTTRVSMPISASQVSDSLPKSNGAKRVLFRLALLAGMIGGNAIAMADQPILLPPSVPGNSQPVLVLSGIESAPVIPQAQTSPQAPVSPPAALIPPVAKPASDSLISEVAPAAPVEIPPAVAPQTTPAVASVAPSIQTTTPAIVLQAPSPTTAALQSGKPIYLVVQAPQQQPHHQQPQLIHRPGVLLSPLQTQRNESGAQVQNQQPGTNSPERRGPGDQRPEGRGPVDRQPGDRGGPGPERGGPERRGPEGPFPGDQRPEGRGPVDRQPGDRGPERGGPERGGPDRRGPEGPFPGDRGPEHGGPQGPRPGEHGPESRGPQSPSPGNHAPQRPGPDAPRINSGLQPGLQIPPNFGAPQHQQPMQVQTHFQFQPEPSISREYLKLLEENYQLKAQLKIQAIEHESHLRISELKFALQEKENSPKNVERALDEKHRELKQKHEELERLQHKLEIQKQELHKQSENLHRLEKTELQVELNDRSVHASGGSDARYGNASDNSEQTDKPRRIEVHIVDKAELASIAKPTAEQHKAKAIVVNRDTEFGELEAQLKKALIAKESQANQISELEHRCRLLEAKLEALSESRPTEPKTIDPKEPPVRDKSKGKKKEDSKSDSKPDKEY